MNAHLSVLSPSGIWSFTAGIFECGCGQKVDQLDPQSFNVGYMPITAAYTKGYSATWASPDLIDWLKAEVRLSYIFIIISKPLHLFFFSF
jgi:hypothetical protein